MKEPEFTGEATSKALEEAGFGEDIEDDEGRVLNSADKFHPGWRAWTLETLEMWLLEHGCYPLSIDIAGESGDPEIAVSCWNEKTSHDLDAKEERLINAVGELVVKVLEDNAHPERHYSETEESES